MSLISGLFTMPFVAAFQAYKQAFFELPLTRPDFYSSIFGGRVRTRVRKNDPGYSDCLNQVTHPVKGAMQQLLTEAGIRKDLMFITARNAGICCAAGTNMFTKGDAVVMIAPGLYEADKEACCWAVKHEICHIKHNDSFSMHCVPAICILAASIFGMCFLPFFSACTLSSVVSTVSYSIFSQWREAKADNFAIEHSSPEELKGGRRFLMALQRRNIEDRSTSIWRRIVFSASGESRFDFLHPSLTSRLQKIERALHDQHVEIGATVEEGKMDNLKKYLVDEVKTIEQGMSLQTMMQQFRFST